VSDSEESPAAPTVVAAPPAEISAHPLPVWPECHAERGSCGFCPLGEDEECELHLGAVRPPSSRWSW
jgi:hypothetical protein